MKGAFLFFVEKNTVQYRNMIIMLASFCVCATSRNSSFCENLFCEFSEFVFHILHLQLYSTGVDSSFNVCNVCILCVIYFSSSALLRRARVYIHMGNFQMAAEDLRVVLREEPQNAAATVGDRSNEAC